MKTFFALLVLASAIQVSKSASFLPKTKVSVSQECLLCKLVVDEIDTLHGDKKTQAAVKPGLDKVCSRLPDSVSQGCPRFVKHYDQVINQFLDQGRDADDIALIIKIQAMEHCQKHVWN